MAQALPAARPGAAAERGPPATIAHKVFGTSNASATCTIRKPTITAMPAKCSTRAAWKPPSNATRPENWNGLPDREPGDDLSDAREDDNNIKQLLNSVINGQIFMRDLEVQGVNNGLHDRPDGSAEASPESAR